MDDVKRRDEIERALDTAPQTPGFQSGDSVSYYEGYTAGYHSGVAKNQSRMFGIFLAGLLLGALVDMLVRTLAGV